MATIGSSIALTDQLTPSLKRMNTALNKMVSLFEDVQGELTDMDSALGSTSGAVQATEGSVSSFTGSSIAKLGALGVAVYGVYKAFEMLSGFIRGGMGLADQYSLTNSRLDLINDGLQTTAQLQDKLFLSAMRTGSAYQDTADVVAKLGTLANHAFKGPDEMILFAEQMNKQFAIGGASLQAQSNAMYQLTQAMASGRLQGDEYRSIIENAPLLAQSIAKYAGVGLAELKEMSSNGEITSDLIKRALFSMIDDTNARFETIPITFGRAFTMVENVVYKAFEPVWQALGSIANNANFGQLLEQLYPVLSVVGQLIAGTIYNFKALATAAIPVIAYVFDTFATMGSNALNLVGMLFTTLFPVMIGLLAGYAAYWVLTNSLMIKNTIVSAATAAWQAVLTAATWALTTAKVAWAAITRGVILTQIILGVVLAALSSPILIIGALIIGAIAIFSAWAAAGGSLREVLASAFEMIVDATQWMVNTSIEAINMLISAYNKAGSVLGKVLGFDFTEVGEMTVRADLSGIRDKYGKAIREGNFLDTLQGDIGIKPFSMPADTGGGFDMSSLSDSSAETADNTKGIKDAMEITDEDLKYMRDLAEREFIKEYQVAEIRVDMSNMQNSISQEMDIDNVIEALTKGVEDAMNTSAEGVHI